MVGKVTFPRSVTKRLISTLMSSRADDGNKDFQLKSSAEFASRLKTVFGELKTLEKDHQTRIVQQEPPESVELFENTETHDVIPTSNIVFKKPFTSFSQRRRENAVSSGFRKPIKKWRKYSLADTPNVTDASNTAAALQFLDEIRKRREKDSSICETTSGKIMFSKPSTRLNHLEDSESDGCQFSNFGCSSSKVQPHIMSDCVVGKKAIKPSKNERKFTSGSNVNLDHLSDGN